MVNYPGSVIILHSILVAIKPVFTRVLMIAVVLYQFRLIVNADAIPESFTELVSALSGLLNGLLVFIVIVPIIIYLEAFFRRLSLVRVSNKKDRLNLEIGGRMLTCLWGLLIVFTGFYVLYDFWKMCILVFFASVGASLLLLTIINFAIGRYSFILSTVFLNFVTVCFYLILMGSFFLHNDTSAIEFDMLFILIMLPRICFTFITKVYLSYIKREDSLDMLSILGFCFSPSHAVPSNPQQKPKKLKSVVRK